MGRVSVKDVRSKIADVYGVPFAASLKPRQVFAVYKNMQNHGKFEVTGESEYHQMNIFEWMMQIEAQKGEHIETFR
jgi:hypothetical protein